MVGSWRLCAIQASGCKWRMGGSDATRGCRPVASAKANKLNDNTQQTRELDLEKPAAPLSFDCAFDASADSILCLFCHPGADTTNRKTGDYREHTDSASVSGFN